MIILNHYKPMHGNIKLKGFIIVVFMWKTFKMAYLIIWIPYIVFGIYLIHLGSIASPNAITTDSFFKNSFYFEGVSCIIIPLILIAGISLYKKKTKTPITKNSIRGKAEILDMKQTGLYLNNIPQIKFLLKITIPNKSPYQIKYKAFVGYLKLNSLHAGAVVPVLVNPKNPENILLG